MELFRKYGTATDLYFPLIKAGSQNFAVTADYTHAAGDVKISKNGGAAATATNSPSQITMGNGAIWKLTLTATEMQAANIVVTIIDAGTKLIEDQAILIQTFVRTIDDLAFPVTTGNGIDVTATGGVGIDWGNVESQGAVNNLSNTIVSMTNAVRTNGAQAGSASTITLDASASATDDIYKGQIIWLASGLGAGQTRLITGYVGATKVVTVSPNWTTSPTTSTGFVILPSGYVPGMAAGAITSAAFAAGAIDNAAIAATAVQKIWDALMSALTTTGSVGKLLADNLNATVSSRASQATLDVVDDFLDTEVAAIKAKTDNLPTDPADASDIATATTAITGYVDTEVAAILAAVDTEVAAIKAKTDNLPTDPADASDVAGAFSTVNATLATIAAYLDTEVAAILADTNELQVDWVNGGRLDLLIDAIKAKTDALPADPADASDIAGAFTGVNTKLDVIDDFLDTEVAAIKAKTDALPTDPADASVIAAQISALNNLSTADILAAVVEGGYSLAGVLRLGLSVLVGKSSGGGTTEITFRDTGDAIDRVVATVDVNGNRTAVVLDDTP